MKPVRALGGPTPGLSAYLAEEADGADWGGFRAHRRGGSYRELVDALADRQLTTALERELGVEPRVAREVEEVAEDIRRDLAESREARAGV